MPNTLGTLKGEIFNAVARSDDVTAGFAERGINVGIMLYAATHEPPELRTNGSLTALANGNALDLTSLTRFLRIDRIYNATGSNEVYPLSFREIEVLWLPTSGYVQFYAVHGNALYYRPHPTGNEILTAYFLQYPARLADDDTEYPFSTGEDYALMIATAFTWLCFEEDEIGNVWAGLAERFNISQDILNTIRALLREEVRDEHNVRRAVA